MSDIFISYARSDRPRAKALAEALEGKGWSTWWDRKIPLGKNWGEVIEEQLDAAGCVVVFWSKESVASEWVKTEAREAKQRQILVPVLIENVKPPLEFRHLQTANLVEWDPTANAPEFDSFLEELNGILGIKTDREPDALAVLKQSATSDANWYIRQAAVQKLAKGREEDPDTLWILKRRAASDEHWAVRRAAIEELAEGWQEDPETFGILKDRASSDSNADVRQAAVHELAKGWIEDPNTLRILKARASSDEHWAVRRAA
ncbi:MAG: toll/interleukin-1 receptor domain-containing protein, partial [Verrucomicrobia bacterium]|nr:toll/interleukin-1 receptor domain-containing protein [Verrucomicrobiota bacterium]